MIIQFFTITGEKVFWYTGKNGGPIWMVKSNNLYSSRKDDKAIHAKRMENNQDHVKEFNEAKNYSFNSVRVLIRKYNQQAAAKKTVLEQNNGFARLRFAPATQIPAKQYLCTMIPVIFEDLGNMSYQAVWDYQEQLLKQKVEKKSKAFVTTEEQEEDGNPVTHHFLMVEHPPVYTLGKSGKMEHVLISEEDRQARGIEFFKINRGGDITFHGPQQIVGYPILDLEQFYTDIGKYLRNLEEVIILTMAEYGLKGERSPGETGVWLDPDDISKARKICAMGIRCSRWVTMHGFAFNVNTDLNYFDYIVPCGIENKTVTSLEKELGYALPIGEVKEKVKKNFEKVFGVTLT